MAATQRKLALGVFLTRHGHHPGAWRQPGSAVSGRPDFRYWAELVKTAERGKFDTAFFADFVGIAGDSTKGIERRHAFLDFEPLTLTAALAAVTDRIAPHLFADAARVLRPGGELWCVWNSPLGYRGELERLVGPTRQVARDPRFTVTVSTRR